jgi:hypothetical protein
MFSMRAWQSIASGQEVLRSYSPLPQHGAGDPRMFYIVTKAASGG